MTDMQNVHLAVSLTMIMKCRSYKYEILYADRL